MIIYRCDKCGKDFPKRSDVFRIRIEKEVYDDSEGAHYYRDAGKTAFFDVCDACASDIMMNFIETIRGTCEDGLHTV